MPSIGVNMTKHTGRGLRRSAALALTFLTAGAITACDVDEFLTVEDPEVASPGSVRDPAALPVVYAGAVRDFTYAYSGTGSIGGGGDNDSHINLSGLLTDELLHTGTFPTRREIDLRAIPTDAPNTTSDNGTLANGYRNLHRARRAAEVGEALFEAAGVTNVDRSKLNSLAGYTYVLFGEIYCEGVPYSSIDLDGNVTYGAPSTRAETFNRAIENFDRAIQIAVAQGDENAEYLARVGKARALLNIGNAAGAAAEVANVPDDWEYVIEHDANSAGQQNGVWAYSFNSGRYGVLDEEGGNGLPWSTDPRSPVAVNPRAAFDTDLGTYISQNKYPDRATDVVLADGREARLIEAEAALGTGAFIGYINAARAVDGLDPVADPGSQAAQVELLFRERGHALYLTAHRLGDLRRMIRQYGYTANQVFPSGTYFRDGLQYGNDVNLPIVVDEGNNPNFTGCLNRDA